jgi:hypothetical protein
MKLNSALRLKHVAWASAAVLVVVLIFFATNLANMALVQAANAAIEAARK